MPRVPKTLRLALAIVLIAGTLAGAGCADKKVSDERDFGPVATVTVSSVPGTPVPIKIGILDTPDSLPLWVAEKRGYFQIEGLPEVEIVTFRTEDGLTKAFAEREIDAAVIDLVGAIQLQMNGSRVYAPTMSLGASPAQGRVAIVAAPGSNMASLDDLKGVEVNVAPADTSEYVFDSLMAQSEIEPGDVESEEVESPATRLRLLLAGKSVAASLPEPYVSLALASGATIPEGGDDTRSEADLSVSVLAIRRAFWQTPDGKATVVALLKSWDVATQEINADPNALRAFLAEKATLPKKIANTFSVSTYSTVRQPDAALVQQVLNWMLAKGYLEHEVAPKDLLAR